MVNVEEFEVVRGVASIRQLHPAPSRRQLMPMSVLAEGSSVTRLPTCAYCGSMDRLVVHPRMDAVVVCAECLDGESEPIDYAELGWGD